ncbi:hypothetical protein HDU67_003356 [Dinochytrium kinnereticum]|nr:hypothetical protein HDU67_003356 [Dinochytrium kinnereticum]
MHFAATTIEGLKKNLFTVIPLIPGINHPSNLGEMYVETIAVTRFAMTTIEGLTKSSLWVIALIAREKDELAESSICVFEVIAIAHFATTTDRQKNGDGESFDFRDENQPSNLDAMNV